MNKTFKEIFDKLPAAKRARIEARAKQLLGIEMIQALPEHAAHAGVPVGTKGTIVFGYDPPEGKVAIEFDAATLGYDVSDDDERTLVLYVPTEFFIQEVVKP